MDTNPRPLALPGWSTIIENVFPSAGQLLRFAAVLGALVMFWSWLAEASSEDSIATVIPVKVDDAIPTFCVIALIASIWSHSGVLKSAAVAFLSIKRLDFLLCVLWSVLLLLCVHSETSCEFSDFVSLSFFFAWLYTRLLFDRDLFLPSLLGLNAIIVFFLLCVYLPFVYLSVVSNPAVQLLVLSFCVSCFDVYFAPRLEAQGGDGPSRAIEVHRVLDAIRRSPNGRRCARQIVLTGEQDAPGTFRVLERYDREVAARYRRYVQLCTRGLASRSQLVAACRLMTARTLAAPAAQICPFPYPLGTDSFLWEFYISLGHPLITSLIEETCKTYIVAGLVGLVSRWGVRGTFATSVVTYGLGFAWFLFEYIYSPVACTPFQKFVIRFPSLFVHVATAMLPWKYRVAWHFFNNWIICWCYYAMFCTFPEYWYCVSESHVDYFPRASLTATQWGKACYRLLTNIDLSYRDLDLSSELTAWFAFIGQVCLTDSDHFFAGSALAVYQFVATPAGIRASEFLRIHGLSVLEYVSMQKAHLVAQSPSFGEVFSALNGGLLQRIFVLLSNSVISRIFGMSPRTEFFRDALSRVGEALMLSNISEELYKLVVHVVECLRAGDYASIFVLRNVTSWVSDASKALSNSMIESDNPTPVIGRDGQVRADEHYWITKLEELSLEFDSIPKAKENQLALALHGKIVMRAEDLRCRVSLFGERPQPPIVFLVGPPGLGKGDMVNAIGRRFLAKCHPHLFREPTTRVDNYDKCKFVVQCGTVNKYDTGMGARVKHVHWDDVHNDDPSMGHPTISQRIISYCNTAKTLANVAELEEKKRAVINPDLITATSNFVELDTRSYYSRGVGRRITCAIHFDENPAFRNACDLKWSGHQALPHFPVYYEGEDISMQCLGSIDAMTAPKVYHVSNRVRYRVQVSFNDPPDNSTVLSLKGHCMLETTDFDAAVRKAVEICWTARKLALTSHARSQRTFCSQGVVHDGECDCEIEFDQFMAQAYIPYEMVSSFAWIVVSVWLLRWAISVRDRWVTFIGALISQAFVVAAADPVVIDALVDVLHPSLILTADATMATIRSRCVKRSQVVSAALIERGKKALPMLLAALTVVGAAYAVGSAVRKRKDKQTVGAHGGYLSVPPTSRIEQFRALNEEYKQFWDKVEAVKKPSSYHQTMKAMSVGTPLGVNTTREDFHRIVRTNTYRVTVVERSAQVWGCKLSGGGRFDMAMSVPAHAVGGVQWKRTAVRFALSDDSNTPRTAVVLSESSVIRARENDDVFLVRAGFGLPGGGLHKHYWDKKEFFVNVPVWRADGVSGVAHYEEWYQPTVAFEGGIAVARVPLIRVVGVPGIPGDCGLPYYGRFAGRWAVIGHHLSCDDNGASVVFPVDQTCYTSPVVDDSLLSITAQARLEDLTPRLTSQHKRSLLGQRPGQAFHVGSYPVVTKNSSSVVRNLAYPLVPEADSFGPPCMSNGVVVGDQFVSPWLLKFAGLKADPTAVELGEVDRAVSDYVSGFKNIPLRRPLDFDRAVDGIPAHDPYNPFNLKSSSGQPYKSRGFANKRGLINREFTHPVFAEDVLRLREQLLGGPVWVNFEWQLKDEVRPVRKFYNTRVFSVAPCTFNLLVRMFLLPIIELMRIDPVVSEVMVGINATSSEWNDFARNLRKNTHFMMGDMKHFDSDHEAWIFCAASEIAARLGELMGYNAEEIIVTRNLVLSCLLQVVECNGDVFGLALGLPSGVSITTLVNCWALAVVMRIAFARACPELSYREHVPSGFYGDDSAMSVSDAASDRFNQLVVREVAATLGYTYTSARKDGCLEAFEDFEDMMFLKRGFHKHDIIPMFVAPLDTSSMFKALAWRVGDVTVTDHERMGQLLPVLWREAFLHPPSVRAELRTLLLRVQSLYGLVVKWPSDEEMVADYERGEFVGWYD